MVTFDSLADTAGCTNPRFRIRIGGCPHLRLSDARLFLTFALGTWIDAATYYHLLHQSVGGETHRLFSRRGTDPWSCGR